MPLFRRQDRVSAGFRPPGKMEPTPTRTSALNETRTSAARCPIGEMTPLRHKFASTPSSTTPGTQVKEVIYPVATGKTGEELMLERLKRRTDLQYHIPDNKKMATETVDEDGRVVQSLVAVETARKQKDRADENVVAASPQINAPESKTVAEQTPAVEEEEEIQVRTAEEDECLEVESRLLPSSKGKLYFQVNSTGGTKHESAGIIIVDVEENAVQMYDRLGRQHGNRPEPGYPLKQEELDRMKAGVELKVGMKAVNLVTALHEEAFRSGEFFLRTEHNQRKKDEKMREKEAFEVAKLQNVPKMSFGTNFGAFASLGFRRRPKEGETGFVVPLQGRAKMSKGGLVFEDLVPLHDPDRSEAVTLFRADYKRDVNGRRIVSVVVDPVIGDKLRPHQRIGVKFLYDCITGERMPGYYGAILADEMGLGKTIQTVATIYTCLKQGKFGIPISRKCLVVAPSSLVKNWCNEFDKWLGEGAVKAFAIAESTPKGDRILSRFDGEGDVLVISYDQLRKYVERISKMNGVDLVVCDEGHRLKNAEIKTTKAVDFLPSKRRIILSGTPIQNDLSEFHAMVGFVNPGILGNRDLFGRVFEEPIMLGRDPDCEDHVKELGADRAHYLANTTQKFILRRTQTINEKYLPAKVDVTVFCRLGESQQDSYEKVSNLAKVLSSTPLVLITALKKLCNHMDLLCDAVNGNSKVPAGSRKGGLPRSVLPKGYQGSSLDPKYGSKLAFVATMLDELRCNGDRDKLVIVSNYTQTLDIIARLCDSKKISFFQLDGKTPIKKRQELVDRFNVPMAQEIVFLLSSKAGGVGLNLIGANRLILFDPDWNPANDAQAMGRVWRDGQKKRVFIYRLLSTGTIEEKIYQRQVSKQGLSANVIDMKDDSKQHFSLDELKALFSFHPSTACETHDLLGCACQKPADSSRTGTAFSFKKHEPKPIQTGPRMDELKSWMHVSNAATFSLDKVMCCIAKKFPTLVSFLFANERDAKKLEEFNTERAFTKDEGGITCDSQGEIEGGKQEEDNIELEIMDQEDSEEVECEDASAEYSISEEEMPLAPATNRKGLTIKRQREPLQSRKSTKIPKHKKAPKKKPHRLSPEVVDVDEISSINEASEAKSSEEDEADFSSDTTSEDSSSATSEEADDAPQRRSSRCLPPKKRNNKDTTRVEEDRSRARTTTCLFDDDC